MQDLSQEERRAKMQELMKKMRAQQGKIQEKLGQILKPEQSKRLEQIRIQVMGPMALASPDVASKLGLTDDQKTKMREAMRGVFAKMREGRGGNAGPPSAEARKKMEESIKTAIMGVLTDDQKKTYEELIGKPFDTSKLRARGMMMGGRGQGRPGAGRGQGRGQGRPGQGRPGRGRPGQGGGGNG